MVITTVKARLMPMAPFIAYYKALDMNSTFINRLWLFYIGQQATSMITGDLRDNDAA